MTTIEDTAPGPIGLGPCKMGAADVVIVRRSVVKGRRVVKTEAFCVRPADRLDCRAMTRAATASTITSITANAVVVVAARKRAR
jgi:hypothetical protein